MEMGSERAWSHDEENTERLSYLTVFHCINTVLWERLPRVLIPKTAIEKKRSTLGWGAMTTKTLLDKTKRGSVVNTDLYQKATPARGLTSSASRQPCLLSHQRHRLANEQILIRKRMCLKSMRNLNCTGTRWGTGCKWVSETHSQPLFSSGL